MSAESTEAHQGNSLQTVARHLAETARAFDSVADGYDGVSGNNALVQIMRAQLWREVTERVAPGGRLLDLGCGTGIDAEYFALHGYTVTATDASHEMTVQTRRRAERAGLADRISVANVGAHELEFLEQGEFDAIYSDLGPLNCVPDLGSVARQARAHLKANGLMIVSVIGRYCPWEFIYFSVHGDLNQARRRFPQQMVPVNLNNQIVWTRYYSPREFFQFFQADFRLIAYRGLELFLPPPYLLRWYERAGVLTKPLTWLDAHLDQLPLVRDAGDHFLMILQSRSTPASTTGVSYGQGT